MRPTAARIPHIYAVIFSVFCHAAWSDWAPSRRYLAIHGLDSDVDTRSPKPLRRMSPRTAYVAPPSHPMTTGGAAPRLVACPSGSDVHTSLRLTRACPPPSLRVPCRAAAQLDGLAALGSSVAR
jgi:hypothetical protein